MRQECQAARIRRTVTQMLIELSAECCIRCSCTAACQLDDMSLDRSRRWSGESSLSDLWKTKLLELQPTTLYRPVRLSFVRMAEKPWRQPRKHSIKFLPWTNCVLRRQFSHCSRDFFLDRISASFDLRCLSHTPLPGHDRSNDRVRRLCVKERIGRGGEQKPSSRRPVLYLHMTLSARTNPNAQCTTTRARSRRGWSFTLTLQEGRKEGMNPWTGQGCQHLRRYGSRGIARFRGRKLGSVLRVDAP